MTKNIELVPDMFCREASMRMMQFSSSIMIFLDLDNQINIIIPIFNNKYQKMLLNFFKNM